MKPNTMKAIQMTPTTRRASTAVCGARRAQRLLAAVGLLYNQEDVGAFSFRGEKKILQKLHKKIRRKVLLPRRSFHKQQTTLAHCLLGSLVMMRTRRVPVQ